MRPSRLKLHLTYRRLPKMLRPTWKEWKEICKVFGDPQRASVAILASATAELERKMKER